MIRARATKHEPFCRRHRHRRRCREFAALLGARKRARVRRRFSSERGRAMRGYVNGCEQRFRDGRHVANVSNATRARDREPRPVAGRLGSRVNSRLLGRRGRRRAISKVPGNVQERPGTSADRPRRRREPRERRYAYVPHRRHPTSCRWRALSSGREESPGGRRIIPRDARAYAYS